MLMEMTDNTEKYTYHPCDDKYYGEKLMKSAREMEGKTYFISGGQEGLFDKVTKQNLKEMKSKPFGYLGEEHSRLRAGTCSTGFRNSQPGGQCRLGGENEGERGRR